MTLRWSKPELAEDTRLEVTAGRHPVVEAFSPQPFVPNDLELNEARRMLVITGPNMGGKSTYMRQAALIVILAGMGSYRASRARPDRATSTASSRASAPPMTLPAASRPSCWK